MRAATYCNTGSPPRQVRVYRRALMHGSSADSGKWPGRTLNWPFRATISDVSYPLGTCWTFPSPALRFKWTSTPATPTTDMIVMGPGSIYVGHSGFSPPSAPILYSFWFQAATNYQVGYFTGSSTDCGLSLTTSLLPLLLLLHDATYFGVRVELQYGSAYYYYWSFWGELPAIDEWSVEKDSSEAMVFENQLTAGNTFSVEGLSLNAVGQGGTATVSLVNVDPKPY